MAPRVQALEAFVKLFADDTELRKSFGALEGSARKAGTAAGLSYSEGLNRSITETAVTARRAGGARPLQLPRVGGREVDLSSPFNRGFQQFKTARELANLTGQGGGIVPGGGPGGGGGGRGGFGGGGGGRGGAFGGLLGQAGRAAGFGGIGSRLGLLANPATAGITAAVTAVSLYTQGVKAATEAERELARAREAGDLEGVTTIFQKSAAAVKDYDRDVLAATDTTTGLEAATRRVLAGVSVAWAQLSGRGVGQLTKEAEAAKKAAVEMWRGFGAPKLAMEGIKRQSDELARSAELSIKAAGDTMAYSAATDMLVQAKQRAADAEIRAIEVEKGRIRLDLVNGKITEAEATDRLADADERLAAVRRKGAQDVAQIEQDRRRQIAEMDAAERDHTTTLADLARQRRDAIVSTLARVVEAEAVANGRLETIFTARAARQTEDTQQALANLKAETKGRRRALELRIGGAQGDERVKLERELSKVTAEEATKRTQIEGKAAEDRIRLVRQTQQELLARTEQLFSIQRTLGQRSLQDDLTRFTTTAHAAQVGSKTQLDALAKVAAQVKALSDQAKAFLGEALSASDRLAKAQGREPSEFVSLTQLATDAAADQARLEEAQRTLQFGGAIKREDFDALRGGALEQLRTQAGAGRSVTARDLARMSVDQGQGFDAFSAGLAGAGGLARPDNLFGAQLGAAFTPPADLFRDRVGDLTGSFDALVTSGDEAFASLEDVATRTFAKIRAAAETTGAAVAVGLVERVKQSIARDLDRDMKLY
ncbi:MAG: hypothetical protein WEG40_13375 [Candidatus Rokuibacteriota bacterium]